MRETTAVAVASAAAPKTDMPKPAAPTRLVSLPISAYATTLALDEDAVYLFTSNAAYRLVADQPPQGLELDLGIGPVLTESAIVFWSKGAIWNAPKQGGAVRQLAKLKHQPQYFVTSPLGLGWVDRTEEGVYTIQSLDGQKPRILVTSSAEISALNMVREWIYFVQRAPDNSWRIGRVRVDGGVPEYTQPKTGATPALLTGSDSIAYFDMGTTEIRQMALDLKSEQTWLKKFVCSPLFKSKDIYCGCVEGLFQVPEDTRKPRVLVSGRHETITFIRANPKYVAWTVDTGENRLAVDRLSTQQF